MTEHESKLKEAGTRAYKTRADLETVERKIAEAQAVVNGAAGKRQVHALAAATGDGAASAAVAKIRKECAVAEQELADLQAALPEARRRAAAAEQQLSAARAAAARDEMMVLVRKRVVVAQNIDRLSAELSVSFGEFFDLGHEIEATYVTMLSERGTPPMVGNVEALHGQQRVIESLPARWMRRFFPTEIRIPHHFKSLASSEALFWNLPADEVTVKGVAAA